MDNSELEDLDQLVSCAGWLRFQEMVAKEWGNKEGGGAMFLSQVTEAAKQDDVNATARLRQIISAQREIQKVMRMCEERVRHLKATQLSAESDAQPLSRRGSL